jgi:RNA polymerase sigma-70 factor (ECF subfamily)
MSAASLSSMNKASDSFPDSVLISRAQSGDREAFGELYRRYLDAIYRYVRSRVKDEQLAEDMTETVFVRSFEGLDRYKERGWPFSSFLYQVARNLLADHYRQARNETSLDEAAHAGDAGETPDEVVMRAERLRTVERAVEELHRDYQEVIRLRVILGLPTSVVASWMGRSEGATRVLLTRALKALRERVGRSDV